MCSPAMRCKPIAAGCAKSVARQLMLDFPSSELDPEDDELLELDEEELLEEPLDGGASILEPQAEKTKLRQHKNNNLIGIPTLMLPKNNSGNNIFLTSLLTPLEMETFADFCDLCDVFTPFNEAQQHWI